MTLLLFLVQFKRLDELQELVNTNLPDRAKRAYLLRSYSRLTWSKIADILGYKYSGSAYYIANRYRLIHQLPNFPSALTIGEMGYTLMIEDEMSYEEICIELNYKNHQKMNHRINGIKRLIQIYQASKDES